eukprot:m.306984 g.306984  ORF g.306984 m.306984 type:complete len:81 (+) comp55310_c0_seq9:903-1145(+)
MRTTCFKASVFLPCTLAHSPGERPYACNFPACGRRFARADELNRHNVVHQRQLVKLPMFSSFLALAGLSSLAGAPATLEN